MPHINPWFPEAKFGVFIHWVLTSVMGEGVPRPDSGRDHRAWATEAAAGFTAEHFDARDWARRFKAWGARYVVLTTKHHIGFALFDTDRARFTAAKSSPAGRDLVREYVDALHDEGLRVGLYYSLPDWCHPDYASLPGGHDPKKYAETPDPERWERFLQDMFAEVRHLCSAYGQIDLLWFDGDWERTADQWQTPQLVRMVENLQPGIVMNSRLRHACLGHYGSPEQAVPLAPPHGWWEQCMTLGEKWPYHADDMPHQKPVGELVRTFGDICGMGGNLLLNVGPYPDGRIPPEQIAPMEGLGAWITAHAEAVYGTEAGLPTGLFGGASTHRGSVLYLIAYDTPRDELVVKGLRSPVRRATHLASGTELAHRSSGGRAKFGKPGWLFVRVPEERMDDHATVVRLEFEDDVCEVDCPSGGRLTWRGRPELDEQALVRQRG